MPGEPDDEFEGLFEDDTYEQGERSEQGQNREDDRDARDQRQGEQETEEEEHEGSERESEHDEGEDGQERQDDLDGRPSDNSRARRSRSRWQRVQDQNRELAERAKAAEERLRNAEELQRRQEEERRERQRARDAEELERLTPEERQERRISDLQRQMDFDRQLSQFRTADAVDKSDFKDLVTSFPALAKHSAAVEENLKQLRNRGTNMPRGVVLRYVLGDLALKQLEKAKKPLSPPPSRKAPKSAPSRGDVQRPQARRNPSSEREKLFERLKDVPL
jgi:DNA repair exonuclease SbcCD ATPase subunit